MTLSPEVPAKTGLHEETVLWSMLEARALRSPDGVMLVDEFGRSMSFSRVRHTAEQVAAGLLEAGVEPGSVVSWQLPTRIDTVILSLALARLDVVQNPIIPLYRRREVGAMLRQCGAAWLLTADTFRGFDHGSMARELAAASGDTVRVLVLDGRLPRGDVSLLPPPPSRGDEVRWIYTTSGTTSAPKGVCHSDASLISGALGLTIAAGVAADDVTSILFPYAHIGGADMLITGLLAGIKTVLMEVFEASRAMSLLGLHGATVSGGGTPFYAKFVEEQRSRSHLLVPSLRALVGGGAPMPEALYHEVERVLGITTLHGFGMTESPMITSGAVEDTVDQLATTVGRPVRGCEVEIRDDAGDPCPTGVAGHVWIRGPMLFKHYLVDGDVVAPFDEGGWFSTGDLGLIRPDGHLVLVGRSKDLIIRKGESFSPVEIEEVISAHPAIADVAVIGVPDPERGERICAVVEVRPGFAVPGVAALREFCAEEGLSSYKAPEQVEVVDALPKTPTMKTRKQELRDRFADRPVQAAAAGSQLPSRA